MAGKEIGCWLNVTVPIEKTHTVVFVLQCHVVARLYLPERRGLIFISTEAQEPISIKVQAIQQRLLWAPGTAPIAHLRRY